MKEQYHNELNTKCYQLKIHGKTEEDSAEFVQTAILDRIKLIEGQWKTLDLSEIVQFVNPYPLMKFGMDELFKQDSTLQDDKKDKAFRWSIILCSMFENLMETLGWKVGDTLDIEEDICDVVGHLTMKVGNLDRSSLLDCVQRAIVNIQVEDRKQDNDKLRTLLIKKKKYNGLNLACILLEQMILDEKDNNTSWMRIVSSQFIDLVVQLIIETDYREEVRWNLSYLLKLESEWKVVDIYNLVKNGLLLFHAKPKKFLGYTMSHGNQKKFNQYLMIIREFPSSSICEYS